MKPYVVQDDFYETESGFELFEGKAGQSSWKKILAGAWGVVLLDEGDTVSVVLFADFEKKEADRFLAKLDDVETESCARCYKAYIVVDDGGLCPRCSKL